MTATMQITRKMPFPSIYIVEDSLIWFDIGGFKMEISPHITKPIIPATQVMIPNSIPL